MGVVAKFGGIRIQRNAVLGQHMKLFGNRIELQVNLFKIIV